jgi:hypothetical protein
MAGIINQRGNQRAMWWCANKVTSFPIQQLTNDGAADRHHRNNTSQVNENNLTVGSGGIAWKI